MPERRDRVAGVLHYGFGRMVRRGLRGVWFRGQLPCGPFVWAANHHSWWDPFLAAVLIARHGREASLMMLQESLRRYRFARRFGVFGTAEPRRGLEYLSGGRVLVVFPEGELRPAGVVGELAGGAAWYARRAGVPLCAVAVRVAMRGHEAPEAYLAAARVQIPAGQEAATLRLGAQLRLGLSELDASLATSDPRRPLAGYRLVVRGRRSWDERIDAVAGRWPWRS